MATRMKTKGGMIKFLAIPIIVAVLAIIIILNQNGVISSYHPLPATAPTILIYTTVPRTTTIAPPGLTNPYRLLIAGNQQYQNIMVNNYTIANVTGNHDQLVFQMNGNYTLVLQISGNSSVIKTINGQLYLAISGNTNLIKPVNTVVVNYTETGRNNAILSA